MSGTSVLLLALVIVAIIAGAILTRSGRGALGIGLIVLAVIVGVIALGFT